MEYYNHLSLYCDSSIIMYNLRKAVWIRLIKSTEEYHDPTMTYLVSLAIKEIYL